MRRAGTVTARNNRNQIIFSLLWKYTLPSKVCTATQIQGLIGLAFLFFGFHAQLICKLEAFRKQGTDASLTFWNIRPNHELSIYSEIVDRIEFHAVRVQFSGR